MKGGVQQSKIVGWEFMQPTVKQSLFVSGSGATVAILVWLASRVSPEAVGPISAGLVTVCATAAVLICFARIARSTQARHDGIEKRLADIQLHAARTEPLLAIHGCFSARSPLPQRTVAMVSPDSARFLMETVAVRRPRMIVEAGCGLSTQLCAHLLRDCPIS